jgi:hypothetical protein
MQNTAVGVANNGHCEEATIAVQVAWLRHVACELCLVLLQAGQLSQQQQLQLVDFCIKVGFIHASASALGINTSHCSDARCVQRCDAAA